MALSQGWNLIILLVSLLFMEVKSFTSVKPVLDNYFLEVNPVHLRRKQFLDARQKEGQSIIELRDELLSLIDEADRANIGSTTSYV